MNIHLSNPTVSIPMTSEQIISAIKNMEKTQQEAFVEDILAAVSPEYLESIREARADYRAGRVCSHEDVFGEK